MSLPKWLKQAVREQVVSPAEAQEIWQISLDSESEEVNLPEHLWSAAERIHLWEAPAPEYLM